VRGGVGAQAARSRLAPYERAPDALWTAVRRLPGRRRLPHRLRRVTGEPVRARREFAASLDSGASLDSAAFRAIRALLRAGKLTRCQPSTACPTDTDAFHAATPEMTRAYAELAPRAEVVVITGASHVANDDRPEAYMRALRSWFASQRLEQCAALRQSLPLGVHASQRVAGASRPNACCAYNAGARP
jgi:pimeloyl-ACP methyl ester carboxylesterase